MDKSSNNVLQRLTYSDQKKRHFLRTMTICATDGRILDICGPYFAVNNDSDIILDILKSEENQDLLKLLKLGDVLLLDRGFRDSRKQLENTYKFEVWMPTCKYFH